MKKYHATLLIIDDDENDLFFIVKALRDIGVTDPIQTSGSAENAIAYMSGDGKYSDRTAYPYPTFVMTDLKMPNTDGFAVLQHLKSNPQWSVIPTVVLSGSRDQDDVNKAYKLGVSSYHVKPTSQDELRTLLKTLHNYWMSCEVPDVDITGKRLDTNSEGKLGSRFDRPAVTGS